MFTKLKQHWQVNGFQLILIIATFALGGSLCGYVSKKILALLHIGNSFLWVAIYIIIVTVLWPLCVLLISIPMGQFVFFKKYIVKIFNRIFGNNTAPIKKEAVINIAIFASGAGSNAQKIILPTLKGAQTPFYNYVVSLIVCNKPNAGVLQIAANAGIPTLLIEKDRFYNGDAYLPEFKKHQIDFMVLAGFLWKVPLPLIKAYPKKIINIHPALLPKYGGKGMYGYHVHEAVVANKENESGITIHYVDEIYDHGAIIFQATCPVSENDTADSLAKKIHELEYKNYAAVIGQLLA